MSSVRKVKRTASSCYEGADHKMCDVVNSVRRSEHTVLSCSEGLVFVGNCGHINEESRLDYIVSQIAVQILAQTC